jgi:hypothetical protein
MLGVALLLLVPTLAIAWWSRRVAHRAGASDWVAPLVVIGWLATTAYVGWSLRETWQSAAGVDASDRSAELNAGLAASGRGVAVQLGVLVAAAIWTARLRRRATA